MNAARMFSFLFLLWIEFGRIKCVNLDSCCAFVGTVVHCSYTNLTYIPKLPVNVTGLVYTGNFLPNITKETFVNISSPEHMLSLNLTSNKIVTISEHSFGSFTGLQYLALSGNRIEEDYLERLLGVLCHMDITLSLNDMGKRFDTEGTFSLMNMCSLRGLALLDNDIANVSKDTMKHFDDIRHLHFDYNKITKFELGYMKRLKELSLNHNNLINFPNFCNDNEPSSLIPNIETLSFAYNRILEMDPQNFRCISSLTYLDISGNYLVVFPNDMLQYLPTIETLTIRNNNGHTVHIERYAFRSESLKILRAEMNGQATSIFRSINDTFKQSPNLISLWLSYISMDKLSTSSLHNLFAPLQKLESFTCYDCKIQRNPSIILGNKDNLTNIDLMDNVINEVNNDCIRSKRYLKRLRIAKNELAHLSSADFPIDMLNGLESVDLSENPFSCDCELKWFIDWLKTANRSKAKYIEEYKCASPQKYVGKKLLNITFSYLECHPLKTWMWVTIVGLPTILVILVSSIFLYRNRWNIKHFIYLLRKRKNYIPIEGANFVYDAFVAYNQTDSDWVVEQLIPMLETEYDCKLCVHERDFHLGAYINDNIVQSIEKSKRMIIVLSDDFATSGWCMFELKIALSKHIEEEFEVIVVLLHAIRGRNMNTSIKTLLETTTYLEWTEDTVGNNLFWNKLKDAVCNTRDM